MTEASPTGSAGANPAAQEMREVFDLKSRAEQELAEAAETRRRALTEADAIVMQAQKIADGVAGDAEKPQGPRCRGGQGPRRADPRGRARSRRRDRRRCRAGRPRDRQRRRGGPRPGRAGEGGRRAAAVRVASAAEQDREVAQRETRALIDSATADAANQADTALRDLVAIASSLRDSMAAASIRLGDLLEQLGDVTDKFAAARQGEPSGSSRFRR